MGECYAPFLTLHYHLGIEFGMFADIFGNDFKKLKWGMPGTSKIFFFAAGDGLRRHSNFLPFAVWVWIDPTGAPPYLTPRELITTELML
jgi:hypothetical protein